MVKCQINQIAALITVSILKATHSDSARSRVGGNVGIAAVEEEVARIGGATNHTAPIIADGTEIVERTIVEGAAARHRQFKRRSKSTCEIATAPT